MRMLPWWTLNTLSLSDDGGEDIELQDLGQGDDLGDVGALDPSLSIEEEPPAEDNLQTGDIWFDNWFCTYLLKIYSIF